MPEDRYSEETLREVPGPATPLREVAAHPNALKPGTRLSEFEITGVVGEGGFGIVYAAFDHLLKRPVALKEYMPAALASRTAGLTVSVTTEHYRDAFDTGLRKFVEEAQTLARFDHPCLVKVYRYWEANGTAYMEMPLYEGMTLKQALKQMSDPPKQQWLMSLLADLLSALETIHRDHTFHRDISPDNILMLKSGRPLLLDFGAARQVLGDMTHALTVILKPGYAPIEQYADTAHFKQGPWTDLYALAAVAYFALTGKRPPPSVGRMMDDGLVPAAKSARGQYSAQLLRAVDKALALKPRDRPQNVAEFRRLLGIVEDAPTVAMTLPAPKQEHRKLSVLGWGAGLLLAVGLVVAIYSTRQPDTNPYIEQAPSAPQHVEKTPIPVPRAFDPVLALNDIFDQRDTSRAVTIAPDKTKVRIGTDPLRFRVRSSRAGYLYVFAVSSDRKSFNVLFPNALDEHNRIGAGESTSLPRPGWKLVAGGPPGLDYFLAIVSEMPRDFTGAGMRKGSPYSDFPLEAAAQVARTTSPIPSPFAGKPVCGHAKSCPNGYGAALVTIEEIK